METKEILLELRNKNSLSQEEMAQKLMITRQAVSRWESGDTLPNTDILKIISRTFGVSINYLLGQPQNTTCQVCGSPLDDSCYRREQDGSLNDKYCKWYYIDGNHKYNNMEQVINDVVPRWNWGIQEQMSDWLRNKLKELEYWRSKEKQGKGNIMKNKLYNIRLLDQTYISDMIKLIKNVFDEFEVQEYSKEGTEHFYEFLAEKNLTEKLNNKELKYWGAFDNDKIIGAIAIRNSNHVSMLFVDKNYHRQGIARSLFKEALNNTNKYHPHIKNITVNSSPYAVEAYKHMGFNATDIEQFTDGMRYTPMIFLIAKD